ncbi:DUF6932 family protein [Mycolicibacterium fortuitum]|uniref:Uncharacterized protein n=1 Tax=Mycolicibacterium fortuitum TaxID=1766 RepID=A0AAE4VJE1_MYCFO|nr:hypothetical protein [Mycolicibacterium fortuitum]MDV7195780.1 hypothetical protein [Mycolicibacterium fortuitum]MDV7207649.1 hypothetical protein [Mycolicibacterium fortuitum]MDV7229705.1 hypothetical protein [Mycolicibacterium fortuitum]MDV7261542.1 hypothetical protein [Mycolicibacterium fortuitum]MDV7286678.1 hypothetical protein [Mycolicibacterium fortuitum]
MLPPCSDDEFGVLPASTQPHQATLAEIRQRFVQEAPVGRERRALIADVLEVHIALIRRLFSGVDIRIWLDGGFITHKRWKEPRDADLVVLVPGAELERADRDAAAPLWTMANVQAARGAADNGRVIVTPKLHTGLGLTDAYVAVADTPIQVENWRRRWSTVKGPDGHEVAGMAKGFVEVIG